MATFEVLLEEKLKNLFKQVTEALVKEEVKSHYSAKTAFLALLASQEEKASAQKLVEAKIQASNYQLIFDRWPALRPLYETIIKDHEAMVAEFEELFEQYKEQISLELLGGKPINAIKGISYGDADCHNHGRMVFIVETDAGKFVYKPHSCAIDLVLKKLLDKYCPNIIYIPKVVDAGKAGFCEFVENQHATNLEDARKFYYNLGGLAAIAISLDMYDLHCENILALNTLPVCIDTETALKPRLEVKGMDSCVQDMNDTVLGTLIFTNTPIKGGKNLGLAFASVPEDIYAPVVDGIVQSGTSYKEEILQGFSQVYDRLLAHREEILKELKTWHCELRVVLRNTSDYAVLIKLLQKPAALEDATWKEKVIAALGELHRQSGEHSQEDVVKAEEECIVAGDIPRFYTYSDELHLYIEDRIVKENYFTKTTVENACKLMQRMNPQDKEYEMEIIRQCLTRCPKTLPERPQKLDNEKFLPTREEIIKFIIETVDQLEASYLHTPNAYKVMLHFSYGSVSLGFLDPSFGCGYGGLAYFAQEALLLAEKLRLPEKTVAKLQGFIDNFYLALEIKVNSLEQLKTFSFFANPMGLASGLGGELYVLNNLMEMNSDNRAALLRNRLLQQVARLNMESAEDKDSSLYNGLGGLLYGLAGCPLTPLSEKLIRRIADKLLTMNNFSKGNRRLWLTVNDRRLISGLGNGMAGVGYAFLEAYKKLQEPRYKTAAKLALEYENEVYSDELKTWPDFRETSVVCRYMHGYCSGAPGIYSFMLKAKAAGLEQAEQNLVRAKASLINFEPLFKDFFCCGNAGVVEALLVAKEQERAGMLLAKILRRYYKLNYFVIHEDKATSVMNQDLFYGITGIAYVALRYLEPNLVKPIID